jgi:deoxyribonuclease IV
MRIGAHVSSAGGPQNAFPKALEMGAEALQVFLSAPQQWRLPALKDEQTEAFVRAREEAGIPVFFHAIYLINFGSQDEAILEKSVASLASYLDYAGKLGAAGTVVHVGSHLGAGFEGVCDQACRLLRKALEAADNGTRLLLENNAGQGNCMGRSFGELGTLIRGLDNDPRVGVCFDTCHAFAMGYDIAAKEGCELAMSEFDREVGFDRLWAVHANDSKMPLGGVRDRHENIGDGHIGYEGFRTLMAHPAFAEVPFLLEVPGMLDKGPDAENIQRLKRLRDEAVGP